MPKHSPVPWSMRWAKKTTDGELDCAIVDANGQIIAEVFGRTSTDHRPPTSCNAKLIAAAPDLLAFVELYLDSRRRNHEKDHQRPFVSNLELSARAVVLHAKGAE